MTALALLLAAIAGLLLVWSYLVYPSLIQRLAARAAPDSVESERPESLEVLVAAADEERVIGDRVTDLLAQRFPVPASITIGCDGCRDDTAGRAREAGGDRVRVREFPERRGKAAVLNDLIRDSTADVVVFTDANSAFDPEAVERLVAPFSDPRVGAACGRLVLEAPERGDPTPETEFWNREVTLKEAEGKLGVCLGANGAIYAARRARILPLPTSAAMDDFLIPAHIARQGMKVVFARDAVAREAPASTVREEMARRFRLGIGAGYVLRCERWLFNARRHPALTLAFLSRKVARWLSPVAFLGAAVAALGSHTVWPVGLAVLIAVALLALTAGAVENARGFAGRIYYFGVINLALAAGIVAGLFGYRRAVWKPTGR